MAYLRWIESPYYVFWHVGYDEEDRGFLAVWPASVMGVVRELPGYSVEEVRYFLDGHMEEVAGYAEFGDPDGALRRAFEEFVADWEEEFGKDEGSSDTPSSGVSQ